MRADTPSPNRIRTPFTVAAAVVGALAVASPAPASAFCGFYVSGADSSLYANATMVALMREGTRTVLSMQNDYQGPPEDFAMVVPVPVVLREDNVKTLPREIFARLDQLAAPRLVEYWEQDPCTPMVEYEAMAAPMAGAVDESRADDTGVRVEAAFAVGEYDIVILSARDSSGLDTWLRRERYNIPEGAGDVLRPYVEQGTKFFVAKVNSERVQFQGGRAILSPLRVHYDAQEFSLPVRLGLLNSQGQQDLLVHILSRNTRFEVANYENAFIPTNIRVVDAVREQFAGFYEALFQQTVARNPRTVVTEYSWDASSCDPCPTEPLNPAELMTLGADTLPAQARHGFVLTRLHYRYSPEELGEDLVFRAGQPVVGGRGTPNENGEMTEQEPAPGGINNFQGRYVITHPWEGSLDCESPRRGNWGGPPNGGQPPIMPAMGPLGRGAPAAPRAANLNALVAEDIPSIGVVMGAPATDGDPHAGMVVDRGPEAAANAGEGGCASCAVASPPMRRFSAIGGSMFWAAIVGGWLVWRRRRNGAG